MDLQEYLANQELAKRGSVMARPQLPAWRQNLPQTLGPTAGTAAQAALQLIDHLLAFGPTPLDAAGAAGHMAQMVPAAKVFHGTPFAYDAVDLAKASQNLGPSHFVTTGADLASDYAKGMFMDSMAKAGNELAPNVRPYMMQAHNSLLANQPLGDDLQSILEAVGVHYNPADKMGKFGKVSGEQMRQNFMNELQSILSPSSLGNDAREALTAKLGVEGGEKMLQKAGFKSIQYAGEEAGSAPQQATKVLDTGILQNLFDALVGSPASK